MSAWTDHVDTLTPAAHWRLNEASGPSAADRSGNARNGTYTGTPTYSQAGAVVDGDNAITLGATDYVSVPDSAIGAVLDGATAVSFVCFVKTTGVTKNLFQRFDDIFDNWQVWVDSAGKLAFTAQSTATGFNLLDCRTASAVDLSAWSMITATFSAGTGRLYIDDTEVASHVSACTALHSVAVALTLGAATNSVDGDLDDAIVIPSVLDASAVAALYAAATGAATGTGASSLPMALAGYLPAPAAAVALRLKGAAPYPAGNVPLNLEAPDPAHYTAAVARWSAAVLLDGQDRSARLTGVITIRASEDASTLAELALVPPAGALDPNDYERKALQISVIGLDAAGAEVYRVRRFTGTTTSAVYDPDSGTLAIEASSDLQGWLEQLEHTTIDTVVGGQWSPHIFDETDDGNRYARDRLATRAAEMHRDAYGRFEVVDWAAKATPDVTLTDAARFANTLSLARSNRRDLVSRVRVNLDFRFVRLRHREIGVHFVDALGFCSYLNQGWTPASKDMVRSAADGTQWTRTGPIFYNEFPGPLASVCTPARAWAGNAGDFCLGAFWTAARRWAQTVTEQYALDVIAPDIETAIGRAPLAEDYGLEATYDGADYERVTAFSSAPTGAVYSSQTDDWMAEATAAEYDGRSAMQTAQTVALAKAKATILRRARGNRVALVTTWRADLSLASTVRVSTPSLIAKGKVAALDERLDLGSGACEMALEIALSRHGGSGSAVDDPLSAAPAPDPETETPSARHVYMHYHLGGVTGAVPDDPDWSGMITNVAPALADPGAPTYRVRFNVTLPEIEATARQASEIGQAASYEAAVPEDELTMSY